MFVILTYDVNQKRVKKALSVCRRYLIRVQRSVFEGHITEMKLKKLKRELWYKLDQNKIQYAYINLNLLLLLQRKF